MQSASTLLLDLGNTRLKVGVWQTGQLSFLGAQPHQDKSLLSNWLRTQLYSLTTDPIQIYGVSVASPEMMSCIESVVAERFHGRRPQWVWPSEQAHGLTNTYPNPQQLGADRWAGMLGLMHRLTDFDRSIVLANLGTATTVDTLSRDKHFLGGLILPGVSMMQNSLSAGTARLPVANGEVQDHPTNTHAAISTGIVAAQLGAIRRQLELSAQRDGFLPALCVSGGAWEILRSASQTMLPDVEIIELPHVVLDGLCRVASHSTPQS